MGHDAKIAHIQSQIDKGPFIVLITIALAITVLGLLLGLLLPFSSKPKPGPQYVWPHTSPIDKSDPYWQWNNSFAADGKQYKKEEVAPGDWQWVIDEAAMKSIADEEARKRQLLYDLTHCVMTDAELKEASGYGSNLNVAPWMPYHAEQKQQELTRAFQVQAMLRSSRGEKLRCR